MTIIRDFQKDNRKCGDEYSSNRLFKFTQNDANEKNCQAKCAEDENCVAFSGIWNNWCIGCDVNLGTYHQGALAFKRDKGKFLNILTFDSKDIHHNYTGIFQHLKNIFSNFMI